MLEGRKHSTRRGVNDLVSLFHGSEQAKVTSDFAYQTFGGGFSAKEGVCETGDEYDSSNCVVGVEVVVVVVLVGWWRGGMKRAKRCPS